MKSNIGEPITEPDIQIKYFGNNNLTQKDFETICKEEINKYLYLRDAFIAGKWKRL